MGNESLSSLTAKELECLKNAATGASGKEIAELMNISERTVRFHLTNIREKLQVQRTVQAVAIYSSSLS